VSKEDSVAFDKARNYAFLLLKFRLRSYNELYRRLRKKGFSEEACKKTLDFLKEHRFVDDNEFARLWISSRIKKPFGLRRLREELKIKGVDKSIIEQELGRIAQDYSEEEVVLQLAKAKFERLRRIEPQKAKSRIYAFLVRRGFSPEIISDVVSQL